MAGDWIKIQHTLPTKPEVFGIARCLGQRRITSSEIVGQTQCAVSELVGQKRAEVVGYLVIFWSWIDQITATGEQIALHSQDIDEVVGCPGFAQAMREEGWLTGRDGSLQIPNYERHNGTSAKARALESEAKRLRRLSDTSPAESAKDEAENCPTKPAVNVRPEKTRGDERRNQSSKSDRKPIGRANGRSSHSSHSPKDENGEKEEEEPFDVSHVDWEHVVAMAERVAKTVPPRTLEDRRAWLRYAVLADVSFGENWLIDATEAVRMAKETKKSRQAHFVGVLKSKAVVHGVDNSTFNQMTRRIEIPDEIWKLSVLDV